MNALSDGINYKCNVCVTHSTTMYMECVYDTLHCTILHCTALHCTALHCIELHFLVLHNNVLLYTAYTVLHCIELCVSFIFEIRIYSFNEFYSFTHISVIFATIIMCTRFPYLLFYLLSCYIFLVNNCSLFIHLLFGDKLSYLKI